MSRSQPFPARVLSFNVLSSSLSEASYYNKLNPLYCDPAYRWNVVKDKVRRLNRIPVRVSPAQPPARR